MKVVIPLAGKGTRLRPHTYVTPKPLLRVGGKPVMSYILDDLIALGVEEIIFIVGYLKEEIEAYVRRTYPQLRVRFEEQKVQNGTAGAVGLARPYVQEDLLIVYVDTLFDADLSIIRQQPPDIAGLIWVKEVEDYQRFGVVVTDRDGNMTRIVEKPRDPISKLANIGLYYIRDWELFFEGVEETMQGSPGPGGEYYITDAFQYMIDRGAKIRAPEVAGWYDCGKPETLLETNRHLLETGRAKPPQGGLNLRIHDPVRIADGVELEDAEIGPNVTIETGTRIRASVLRDCIIGENVTIEECNLHDSLVSDHAELRGVRGSVDLGHHSVVRAGD